MKGKYKVMIFSFIFIVVLFGRTLALECGDGQKEREDFLGQPISCNDTNNNNSDYFPYKFDIGYTVAWFVVFVSAISLVVLIICFKVVVYCGTFNNCILLRKLKHLKEHMRDEEQMILKELRKKQKHQNIPNDPDSSKLGQGNRSPNKSSDCGVNSSGDVNKPADFYYENEKSDINISPKTETKSKEKLKAHSTTVNKSTEKEGTSLTPRNESSENKEGTSLTPRNQSTKKAKTSLTLEKQSTKKAETSLTLEKQFTEKAETSLTLEKQSTEKAETSLTLEKQSTEKAETSLTLEKQSTEKAETSLTLEKQSTENSETSLTLEKQSTENSETSLTLEKQSTEKAETSLSLEKQSTENSETSLTLEKQSTEKAETSLTLEKQSTEKAETSLTLEKQSTENSETSLTLEKQSTENSETSLTLEKQSTEYSETSLSLEKQSTENSETSLTLEKQFTGREETLLIIGHQIAEREGSLFTPTNESAQREETPFSAGEQLEVRNKYEITIGSDSVPQENKTERPCQKPVAKVLPLVNNHGTDSSSNDIPDVHTSSGNEVRSIENNDNSKAVYNRPRPTESEGFPNEPMLTGEENYMEQGPHVLSEPENQHLRQMEAVFTGGLIIIEESSDEQASIASERENVDQHIPIFWIGQNQDSHWLEGSHSVFWPMTYDNRISFEFLQENPDQAVSQYGNPVVQHASDYGNPVTSPESP